MKFYGSGEQLHFSKNTNIKMGLGVKFGKQEGNELSSFKERRFFDSARKLNFRQTARGLQA